MDGPPIPTSSLSSWRAKAVLSPVTASKDACRSNSFWPRSPASDIVVCCCASSRLARRLLTSYGFPKKKQGHGQTHVLYIPLFTTQSRNFFFVLHLRICNMSIYVGIWKIGLTIVYCKVGARSRFKLCPLARQIFILKGEKLLLHNFHIMIPKFPSILFICIYLANLQSKSKLKAFLVFSYQ